MFRITLVLAAAPGRPEGDVADRIVLLAALTPQETLDLTAHEAAGSWPAERTRPDGTTRSLGLIRAGNAWQLRSTRHEDEPLWSFEARVLRPGEYVVLTRPEGEATSYRVVGVDQQANGSSANLWSAAEDQTGVTPA